MVCSSNWPRLFCLQKWQIALDRSPRQEGCNIRNDGSNGLALGKILTGMVFKYLFIVANGNDSRQNGNFSPTGNRCGEIESTQSRSMVGWKRSRRRRQPQIRLSSWRRCCARQRTPWRGFEQACNIVVSAAAATATKTFSLLIHFAKQSKWYDGFLTGKHNLSHSIWTNA